MPAREAGIDSRFVNLLLLRQAAGMHGLELMGIIGMIALLATAAPGRSEEIPLWEKGAPGAKGIEKDDLPTLRIFPAPKEVKAPVPAVLLIPGGGYKHLSGYGDYQKFFQTRPVRFFALKYRLPVHGYRHPAPLQDARRAVATMRAHAGKWNLDPTRIMVVGFSSGGHVATTLATHYQPGNPDAPDPVDRFSSRPDALALFCPVVSMKNHPHRPSVARLLGPDPSAALIDNLSNELQVDARTPPTFLAHAKDDRLVPPENSILFHEALKKAGVATKLRLYGQGGHNVTSKPNPWRADLGDWLVTSGILPEGTATPTPESAGVYEPTSSYTTKTVAGWQVLVHNSLLPEGANAETGAAAQKRLEDAMERLKSWIAEDRLARLLKVKIWLEVDSTRGPHGHTSGYQYHPGRDWLVDMDFNPAKHKCVEFGNAASLAKRPDDPSVTVLLHELAHAYHDQVLTFEHANIMAAYQRAVEGTAYPKNDWVKSDHKEFFAGVTTRYFGTKVEREALVERDPVLARELLKIWGKPRATIDRQP